MQKLEMLIKTVDAHYDSNHEIHCYYLSCSLLNVARGRCDLMIVDENSNINDKITIQYKRAIMSGSIKIKSSFFKSLPFQFSLKNDRPPRIELIIDQKLNINKNGILFLEQEITTQINEYKFYIPLL